MSIAIETDTKLATASNDLAKHGDRREQTLGSLHRIVGDEPGYRYIGRRRVRNPYRLTDAEALEAARTVGPAKPWDAPYLERALEQLGNLDGAIAAARAVVAECNATYRAAGGWSRFFLVSGGHIHSSMDCQTCNRDGALTAFSWLPALSGLTEAEAVAEHGAILCSVCFPSAPVEWTNGRELEAQARKAAQCAGSGTYYDSSKPHEVRRVSKWATCPECGGRPAVTSTGKLRAHNPAA